MNNIQQMPAVFTLFCGITDIEIKCAQGRSTVDTIEKRRLFVAVAICIYDPVFLHGYSGKMTDGLRKTLLKPYNVMKYG